jgi:predicted transglutaminase-like cysteine proteinase
MSGKGDTCETPHRSFSSSWLSGLSTCALLVAGLVAGAMPVGVYAQNLVEPFPTQECQADDANKASQYTLQMTATPTPAAGSTSATKSDAILGGMRSKLDEIRFAQANGTVMAAPVVQAINAETPSMSSLPVNNQWHSSIGLHGACAGRARDAQNDTAIIDPVDVPQNTILGSLSVAIQHTPLDAAWARVNGRQPSRRLRRTLTATGALGVGDRQKQISMVNAWVNNKITYAEDSKLYRKADYWASARETLQRGAGDCEDFAIAKMELLMAMGISRDQLRLVVARDLVRNADHAVLVVSLPEGAVLLDNATDRLLDARMANDYRPIMSFTYNQKFIHGYALAAQPVLPAIVSVAMLSVPSAPLTLP